jgi:hypothetical protein
MEKFKKGTTVYFLENNTYHKGEIYELGSDNTIYNHIYSYTDGSYIPYIKIDEVFLIFLN